MDENNNNIDTEISAEELLERKKRKKRLLRDIVDTLFFLAAFITVIIAIYYTVYPSRGYFHADCSDTIFWAEASYSSGKIVSDTYNYAAILPFGGSLIMLPLVAIFGVTMTAHVTGMVIFTLLFTAAIYFMIRALDMSNRWACLTVVVSLLIFLLSEKLREIFFGHVIYYSLGLFLLAVILALSSILMKRKFGKKPATYVIAAVLFIFATLSCLNGMQIIVLSVLPVLAAVGAYYLFENKKFILKENIAPVVTVASLFVSVPLGLLLLKIIKHGVVAGYADAYSTYSEITSWSANLLKFPEQFFTLLGVSLQPNDPLFTVKSVMNMILIAAGIILVLVPLAALLKYGKLKFKGTKLLLWCHAFVVAFSMYGFVMGNLSGANWRLCPMLGTSVFATVAVLRELWYGSRPKQNMFFILSSVLVLTCTLSAYNVVKMPKDYGQDNAFYKAAELIESENLEYGYATFWNSQALEVITPRDVHVRCINVSEIGASSYFYQSDLSWYKDRDGVSKYFLLFDINEYNTFAVTARYTQLAQNLIKVLSTDTYMILVYNVNPVAG